jgi:predicted metalloprotease
MAYVIAHEIGTSRAIPDGHIGKNGPLRQRLSKEEYNQYSVRLELQADFYAGLWAHYAQQIRNGRTAAALLSPVILKKH